MTVLVEEQVVTLTKADISERLSQMLSLSKPDAVKFVNRFYSLIIEILSSSEDLKLSGFGSFIIHHKKERPGRNPKSLEPKVIAARKVVVFKAALKLKAKLQDKED